MITSFIQRPSGVVGLESNLLLPLEKSNTTTKLPNYVKKESPQQNSCLSSSFFGISSWAVARMAAINLGLLLLLLCGDVESNPGPPRRSIAGTMNSPSLFRCEYGNQTRHREINYDIKAYFSTILLQSTILQTVNPRRNPFS